MSEGIDGAVAEIEACRLHDTVTEIIRPYREILADIAHLLAEQDIKHIVIEGVWEYRENGHRMRE